MINIWQITDDAEWQERRRRHVTGTDCPAVLGVNRNKSAAKVAAEKLGLISPEPQNEFLQFRLALEAAVIDMLKFRRPGWDVRRMRAYVYDDPTRRGASLDALATDPERDGLGVIECKTVLASVYEREWRDLDEGDLAEAPLHYQIQTLHQMMLCNAAWGAIPALVLEGPGNGTFKLAPVERNPEAEQRILDAIARFWAIVDTGRIPLPLNYDLDADVIAALYPEARIKEPPLDLSQDNRLPTLLERRKRRKDYVKRAEKWVDRTDAEIKEKLGHHESALLPNWRISWKLQKRAEHIVAEWQGRVLRVTQSKTGATP